MKKKYLSIITALLVGAFMTSCSSDFLEADNRTAGGNTDDDYFSKNPSSMLVKAYDKMKSVVNAVDINVQGTDLYVNNNNKPAGEFSTYAIDTQNSDVKDLYLDCYSTINYANGVMKYGPGTAAAQEAEFLRGYCYYMLTQHFGDVPYITSYIQTSATSYPRTPKAQIYESLTTGLKAVYNNCKLTGETGHVSKDAVAALIAKIYLAWGWDEDVTCADPTTGEYTVKNTEHFAEAETWAGNAINNKKPSQTFAQMWSQDNEDKNPEILFSIQYDRNNYPGSVDTGGHSLQNTFGGYYGATKSYYIKNGGSFNSQSVKAMYLFEENDQRYYDTFMTTVYNSTGVWGTEGYYAYYNATPAALKTMAYNTVFFPYWVSSDDVDAFMKEHKDQFQKGSNVAPPFAVIHTSPRVTIKTINASGVITTVNKYSPDEFDNLASGEGLTFGSLSVKKFDDKNSILSDKSNDYRDIVVLQLSDMYLTRAEACLMQGKDYMGDLNTVRSRTGNNISSLESFADYKAPYTEVYPSFTVKEIDLILDERARELYAQGSRWMDLRRTKQLVRYNVAFNKYISSAESMKGFGEYKLYRPIPQAAMEVNTGITPQDQNPGYVMKTAPEPEKTEE